MLLSAMRPTEGGITSCRRQPCVPARFIAGIASADAPRRLASTDVPQCNASDLRVFFIPAKRALRPGVIFASLASADVPRRLASHRRWHHFLPKAALRPRMLLRALRPGMIFASLASADAFRRLASNQLASLPAEGSLASPDASPGIASRHDLCRHCVIS